MDLRQLTTFQVVAETLSFSQTALHLNYAQSTVSAQIKALEDELQVPLFDRLGKRIVLTTAGTKLIHYAEQILSLENEARIAVSQSETLSGKLQITAPETMCTYRLPGALQNFHSQYPQVELDFKPKEINLHQQLLEGKIDIAFVMQEHPLQHTDLHTEVLCTEKMVFIVGTETPLAKRLPKQLTGLDLHDLPMVLTETTCGYRRLLERQLQKSGVLPEPPMEFHSVEAIKQCVISGIGISFLPEMAVRSELAAGSLKTIEWHTAAFQVAIQMIWHKDKWLSPSLQAFIDTVRSHINLSENLPTEENSKVFS